MSLPKGYKMNKKPPPDPMRCGEELIVIMSTFCLDFKDKDKKMALKADDIDKKLDKKYTSRVITYD